MNKYHAKKTYSELCLRMFDSRLEAKRGEELELLRRAGEIIDLKYQVRIDLCEITHHKVWVVIDFVYYKRVEPRFESLYTDGQIHYSGLQTCEDAKGVLAMHSRIKYAWLKEKYNVDVILYRG